MVQGNGALPSLTPPKESISFKIIRQSYHHRMAVVDVGAFGDAYENKKEGNNMKPQMAYI